MTTEDRRAGLWRGLGQADRNGGPTQMALRLKQSLESLGRFCPEDVLERYLQWWRTEGFDTGPTAAGVFALIEAGLDRETAVRQIHEESGGATAGCNPAHRAAPLAMMEFLPLAELGDLARREARLTHLHADAGETSAAVVLLARHLIDGLSWPEALQATAAQVQGPAREALLAPPGASPRPGRPRPRSPARRGQLRRPALRLSFLPASLPDLRRPRQLLPRPRRHPRRRTLGWGILIRVTIH